MRKPDLAKIHDPISTHLTVHLKELADGFDSLLTIRDIVDLYYGRANIDKIENFVNFYLAML